jgi:hypothetical protein
MEGEGGNATAPRLVVVLLFVVFVVVVVVMVVVVFVVQIMAMGQTIH